MQFSKANRMALLPYCWKQEYTVHIYCNWMDRRHAYTHVEKLEFSLITYYVKKMSLEDDLYACGGNQVV